MFLFTGLWFFFLLVSSPFTCCMGAKKPLFLFLERRSLVFLTTRWYLYSLTSHPSRLTCHITITSEVQSQTFMNVHRWQSRQGLGTHYLILTYYSSSSNSGPLCCFLYPLSGLTCRSRWSRLYLRTVYVYRYSSPITHYACIIRCNPLSSKEPHFISTFQSDLPAAWVSTTCASPYS